MKILSGLARAALCAALLACVTPDATPEPPIEAGGEPGANSSPRRLATVDEGTGQPAIPNSDDPQGDTADSIVAIADRSRIQGSANANVWMVIISDFQCPYCKRFHDDAYPLIVKEYVNTGKLRIAYVNLPLQQHQHAWPAAERALCAGVQGKFWEYHDAVFSTLDEWQRLPPGTDFFDTLAGRQGLDVPALKACVASRALRPLIQADYDRSIASGATSTPTFIIGGQVVLGAQPIEVFRQVIDAAIAAGSR